jgi:hypothetical protein
MAKINYETLFYPGKYLSEEKRTKLTAELRSVASQCFDETPHYQVLTGDREEYERAVITLARNKQGKLIGFVSALVLKVEEVGNVLHLGLTCVAPEARGLKLTHKLTSKMLMSYLFKESPLTETWITNCACVLSSLGNVALYFEDLYPSPYGVEVPSMTHVNIAKEVDRKYRGPIAINDTAKFNLSTFIFEASVEGTTFSKDSNDLRFHHRDQALTRYYQDILDFERGDEVLQVGKVSLMTFPKYIAKKTLRRAKKKFLRPVPEREESINTL